MKTATLPIAAALLAVAGCSSLPFSNSLGSTDKVYLLAAGSWDRNRDNVVTCDEWKQYAGELFDQADANRDGSVDATEWGTIVSNDRMFETANLGYFDTSGDGKVTRAEMIDRPNPAFVMLDKGNTCQLSGAQIAGARSQTQTDTFKPKDTSDIRDKEDALKR